MEYYSLGTNNNSILLDRYLSKLVISRLSNFTILFIFVPSEKCGVEQLLAGVQQERDSQRCELEALRRRHLDAELQLARLRSEVQQGCDTYTQIHTPTR